ncbi:hypothetical protein D3C80_1163690 [compost metagenome]
MNAIDLHQLRHPTHAVEEKRHQRHVFLGGKVAVDLFEGRGVFHPVIGRQTHPQQQDLGPRAAGAVDHRRKILLQLRRQLPTQAIIAAQLQHHHRRLMLCKQRR